MSPITQSVPVVVVTDCLRELVQCLFEMSFESSLSGIFKVTTTPCAGDIFGLGGPIPLIVWTDCEAMAGGNVLEGCLRVNSDGLCGPSGSDNMAGNRARPSRALPDPPLVLIAPTISAGSATLAGQGSTRSGCVGLVSLTDKT